MSKKIDKLLKNQGDNYIFPFLWMRGESENVLREYMAAIHNANIGAVCVESRPHPDFCGEQWWHDMDIILDEARKRNMKVWILDDQHFPTGYANGAMDAQPDELHRQSVCRRMYRVNPGEVIELSAEELNTPEPFVPNRIEHYMGVRIPKIFEDDKRLGIYAISSQGEYVDLEEQIKADKLTWCAPDGGTWKVYIIYLSRNKGYHRDYINMLDRESCRVLLDAVYEPHYARYGELFGTTIAGFFSDEPELGNGHLYDTQTGMGQDTDYPWSAELEEKLKQSIGSDYVKKLYLLWENHAEPDEKAKIRYSYMDAVTALVKENFSFQIGNWCRGHGVQYIGHMIEDNDQHTGTGSSLGHYFRGLSGQDMSGIDDIGGQVLPQGEELDIEGQMFGNRIGGFYHYMLGKLASSAAMLEPLKKGNSMCEIFGAYGWSEGVRLEKYLADHFMVRGINHFVPHAFSMDSYPDRDCPPHFYAHGNNPQYRHFGALMKYMNRVCELISGGKGMIQAAVLYHAEGEWTGKYMQSWKPAKLLYDAQIDYIYIPQEAFGTAMEDHISFKALVIPEHQFITAAFAKAVGRLCDSGKEVYFIGGYPKGICDGNEYEEELMTEVKKGIVLQLEELVPQLNRKHIGELQIDPPDNRIRTYHYEHTDGTGVLMLVNEGVSDYKGKLLFTDARELYRYDAWNNEATDLTIDEKGIELEIMPQESFLIIMDRQKPNHAVMKKWKKCHSVKWNNAWKRSISRSIEYPAFSDEKDILLPDQLEKEKPEFSGFVRYENTFEGTEGARYLLEITDAHEGVEVFLNGRSMGIQVVPTYRYVLEHGVRQGNNEIVIEVATTLERENADIPNPYGIKTEPTAKSGISGEVFLWKE